jgi:hypothetical protein
MGIKPEDYTVRIRVDRPEVDDVKVVTAHKIEGGFLVTCELKQVLITSTLESQSPWNAICYEFQSIECMDEKPALTKPFEDPNTALEFAKSWVKGEYMEGEE